ncbi:MAG: hypothetical protein C4K58_03020 [Flavobacteriaceae bacterium]|nr:MAG: hypothetical protein C4K58_03020 [Flavobacteriaceae bacterium]
MLQAKIKTIMKKIFAFLTLLGWTFLQAQDPSFTVYYESGVSTLTPAQKAEIKEKLSSFLGSDYGVSFLAKAYTDNVGSAASNQKLSEKRGANIQKYISEALDLEIQSIKVESLGEQNASDVIEKANSNDRRVDVFIEKAELRKTEKKIEKPVVEVPAISPPPVPAEFVYQEKFPTIYFTPGRSGSYITRSNLARLDELVTIMQAFPELNIHAMGHVCCGVSEIDEGYDNDVQDHNLSLNRAQYVKNYLVSKGIEADRITIEGLGFSSPAVSPENDKKDESMNRRVEIKQVFKGKDPFIRPVIKSQDKKAILDDKIKTEELILEPEK